MGSLTTIRLLVLEPDPRVRLLVSKVLGDRFEVHATGTIEEAVALLETHAFEAIICDWQGAFGPLGIGFGETLKRRWGGLRRLDLGAHVVPHLAVLERCQLSQFAAPKPSQHALLLALWESADEPCLPSRQAN